MKTTPRSNETQALAEALAALGAKDPAYSAKSPSGRAELARRALLRSLWDEVPAEGSDFWRKDLAAPGLKAATDRLLQGTGTADDIALVHRQALVHGLMSFIDVLERGEPAEGRFAHAGADVRWAVFEVDQDDEPKRQLGSLHGLLLGMDPTGRGGAPPEPAKAGARGSKKSDAAVPAPRKSRAPKASPGKSRR